MGIKRNASVVGVGVLAVWGASLVGGCDTFALSGSSNGPYQDPGGFGGGGFPTTVEDDRPVVSAPTPPPPISGGTLLITHDGLTAVAADPDRDRVVIVDLIGGQVRYTVPLEAGDEPGRLVEDGAGRVHVALRRGGALVTIDVGTGALVARRTVCGAPRGVAYDAAQDQVHVACSGGELVTFAASGGDAVRRVNLGVDLRDVVVRPNGLIVSRFKTAELLYVDAHGKLTSRVAPHKMRRFSDSTFGGRPMPGFASDGGFGFNPTPLFVVDGGPGVNPSPPFVVDGGLGVNPTTPVVADGGVGFNPAPPASVDSGVLIDPGFPVSTDPISPGVAWRTVAASDGNVFVLHQYGFDGIINLPGTDPSAPPFGPGLSPGFSSGSSSASPYGTPVGGCGGLVQPCLSRVGTDGAYHMGMPLVAPVLTVDAAVSSDAKWIAFVSAGLPDPGAPNPLNAGSVSPATGQVSIVSATGVDASGTATGCMHPQTTIPIGGQTIAVAFNPASAGQSMTTGVWLVVQSREPSALLLVRDPFNSGERVVSLGGPSMLDTAHDLFHKDAGAGIACASCHAEGEEDGRVWQFNPTGPRRTQAVNVGLTGTEPFHWDGDMKDFGTLVDEVMVRRMGGAAQSTDRKTAMQNWLFSLHPRSAMVSAGAPAAVRGQALFESPTVGCFVCHAGAKLTNDQSLNVGTTDASHFIQVPSLHGVGFRAPFLHDGRAATLEDRFNPAIGGGDSHGHTSQLSASQVSDLIAYLESL